MTWDWNSTDQLWRAGSLPSWVLLALAGLIGLVLLVTLLRVERTFANGLLAALTLAALAIALASQFRTAERTTSDRPAGFTLSAFVPALACVDDMAGETALTACEKVLFGAPDTIAAAVFYAAAQLNRLTALGDAAAANREMTPHLAALRRAVERDRYGIFAYVLASRDNCQPEQCAAYAAMTDHNQVAANMNDLIYEGLVSRYAPSWNATPASSAQAALTVGRPTTIDFPTAASIPPVNIMSAEPPPSVAPPAVSAAPATETPAAQPEASKRSSARSRSQGDPSAAAKARRPAQSPKQSAPPSRAAEGPVQLTPNTP